MQCLLISRVLHLPIQSQLPYSLLFENVRGHSDCQSDVEAGAAVAIQILEVPIRPKPKLKVHDPSIVFPLKCFRKYPSTPRMAATPFSARPTEPVF